MKKGVDWDTKSCKKKRERRGGEVGRKEKEKRKEMRLALRGNTF